MANTDTTILKVMLAQQRRKKILEMIKEEGSVRSTNLSNIFDVSEVTIRQDLDKLANQDLIVREHGGAFLKNMPDQVKTLTLGHNENMEKKARIAGKAAEFINEGESIILDSGSTTTEIAKCLTTQKNITIITNALNIALILGSAPGIYMMVTGGEFKPPTLSLTGEKSADFLRDVHVDKVFLATAGISPNHGLTYPGFSDLPVKKAMIEVADIVYLVADSTKIGKGSLATLGGIDLIDVLITDADISDKARKQIENKGVEVVIA